MLFASVIFFFFADRAKARNVRQNIDQVKPGILSSDVKKILSTPDTVYYMGNRQIRRRVLVLQYYQGLRAPMYCGSLLRRIRF